MAPERPSIAGSEKPEAPYPVVVHTSVTSGFGRGSAELGIPTANIPPGELASLEPGVYFGWARVAPRDSAANQSDEAQAVSETQTGGRKVEFNHGSMLSGADLEPYPMVMSIGWNPFYHNKEKSAEVHILHKFAHQFYGAQIGVVVTGYLRAEQSYDSVEALIADIHRDIEIAENSLRRPAYLELRKLA